MATTKIQIPAIPVNMDTATVAPTSSTEAHTTEPEQAHWLYETAGAFWTKFSTYPSQRFLDTISKYVYELISCAVGNVAKDLQKRIGHFFYYVCGRTPMSRGQILHAVILLRRLISYEKKDIEEIIARLKANQSNPNADVIIPKDVFEPVVTEGNLGTLLLCALSISGKINEDVPFNNKYWSNLLHIDIRIVKSSESVFLQRLRFDVHFDADEIQQLAKTLNLV